MFEKTKNWIKDKWQRFKRWILVGVGIGAIALAAPLVIPESEVLINGIGLEVPKEDVITSVEKDGVVKYLYNSRIEVPQAKYKGLDEDLSKRTNNVQFFPNGDETIGKFYAGQPFYKKGNVWHQTETATVTKEVFDEAMKVSWFNKLINYAYAVCPPDCYTLAGDGHILDSGNNDQAGWDASHDSSTGDTADYTGSQNLYAGVYNNNPPGTIVQIWRHFLPVDTSDLSSTPSAALLYVYVKAKDDDDNDAQAYIGVVQTDQPSDTQLTTADYNNCGATDDPTQGATALDITGIGTSQYVAWTLNATGRGWIVEGGTTMLGLREGHDIEDDRPSLTGFQGNFINIYNSEWSGTTRDPYLELTIPSPPAGEESWTGASWFK